MKVILAIEVRRNDQPEIFTRLVSRSVCRRGQSGFAGDGFVAGFAHQGERRRRRRGGGIQGVFSMVRRESEGRRPPTGKSPRRHCFYKGDASDAELAGARAVREKEAKDKSKSEAELVDVVDTLERAISIIQREMSKNPAFLQKKIDTRNINNVISALTAVIDAAPFPSADKQKSVALVRGRQASDDDDSEISVPSAAAYVSHSSDIVDVLNDLLDKAEAQLDETRHADLNAAHNFALLKQSLEDQLAQDSKALEKAKADRTEYSTSLVARKSRS